MEFFILPPCGYCNVTNILDRLTEAVEPVGDAAAEPDVNVKAERGDGDGGQVGVVVVVSEYSMKQTMPPRQRVEKEPCFCSNWVMNAALRHEGPFCGT